MWQKEEQKATARFQERVQPIGERYLFRTAAPTTVQQYKCEVANAVHEMEANNEIMPEFLIVEASMGRIVPDRMNVSVRRNYARYNMNAAEFRELFGQEPKPDDLHRINCGKAGKFKHKRCGFCEHGPRFMCRTCFRTD